MNKFSSKTKVLFVFMFLIYISFFMTYYNYYKEISGIIISEHTSKIRLIEASIYNETKYSEVISNIAEKALQDDMEEISYKILDEYSKKPNVLSFDLKEMKANYGDIDIYFINEDLKVVASSITEEIGMSFDSYPSFSKTLRNRLNGDIFRSDPINYSFMEGELKKYSYMPTPDHKYLVELSVNIKDQYPELDNLNVLYLSKSLKDKYPFIENIEIFRYNEGTGKSSPLLKDEERNDLFSSLEKNQLIEETIKTNEVQKKTLQIENDNYTIKYIPYSHTVSENKLIWWGTYIMEVVYNNTTIINSLHKQKIAFYGNTALITIFYFGFIYMSISLFLKNKQISNTDYLTKLPNRRKFEEFMELKIIDAKRHNTKICVFFMDLDGFKQVNDSYGHSVGDKLLQNIASRMKEDVPKNSIVSRIGGDEFVVAVPCSGDMSEIESYGKDLYAVFDEEFIIDSIHISIKSSIGISIYPEHGSNIEELILKADTAMYFAKQNKLDHPVIL